jgi:hypothetical protein
VNFALFLPTPMHTKNQFIQVLHGYLEASRDDAKEVEALKEVYPYSQVLHALAARLGKDLGLPTQKEDLQLAAVHAADRAALKHIMTRTSVAWPKSHEAAGMEHPEAPASISTSANESEHQESVAEEVIHDLNRLHELKHNFESIYEATSARQAIIDASAPAETESLPGKKKSRVGRKPGRAKAQRIIELAKALENDDPEAEPGRDTGEDQKKRVNGGHEEIIGDTKKKTGPEIEEQQEQLEIINQFINSEPRISNSRDKEVAITQEDLSTIKGGDFGDHVISETLVEILLNQGKKERAIEVLKKLIWKFPQKKAYFAAQIEDLKK